MMKFVAVAALVASTFVVPVAAVPAQAAAAKDLTCVFAPLLKADCWHKDAAAVAATTAVVVKTAAAAPAKAAAPVAAAASTGAKLVLMPWLWWAHCTAAPAGSGHLLDCK